jgi:hypothetical protein
MSLCNFQLMYRAESRASLLFRQTDLPHARLAAIERNVSMNLFSHSGFATLLLAHAAASAQGAQPGQELVRAGTH